jgi:hypothetical protein
MSHPSALPTFVVTGSLAAVLATVVLMTPPEAFAANPFAATATTEKRPMMRTENAPLGMPGIYVAPSRPGDPRDRLTPRHEIAAMDAIHTALNETADGSTYVWHDDSGQLSAIVKPTTSFRNSDGQICRHIHLMLNTGRYSRKSEGIACRLDTRIWSLEG